MLTLRLSRTGTKKRPVYHLVAADSRSPRDGRFVENLGYYIPAKDVISFKQERIQYWIGVGAKVSGTAVRLIAKAKKAPPPVAPVRKPRIKKPAAETKSVEAAS